MCLLLLSLLMPACVRKKSGSHVSAQKTQEYGKDFGKASTYDENVGAFVLEDDAQHDIFSEATDTGKGETKAETDITKKTETQAKKSELDDAWAWQELDEEQPTKIIHFDYDSAKIRADQETDVRYDAQLAITACKEGAKIIVEGFSCLITRSEIYNQALSQKRANAVKKRLIKLGVPAKCIKAVGRGTSCLITHEEGKQAQAANRRVEVKFIYPREEKAQKKHVKEVKPSKHITKKSTRA